jgi:hypothetical protein
MSLPTDKMYALRHGVSGKIWLPCGPGGFWLFRSPYSLEQAWNTMKEAGVVSSEFSCHKVIVIKLVEVSK